MSESSSLLLKSQSRASEYSLIIYISVFLCRYDESVHAGRLLLLASQSGFHLSFSGGPSCWGGGYHLPDERYWLASHRWAIRYDNIRGHGRDAARRSDPCLYCVLGWLARINSFIFLGVN